MELAIYEYEGGCGEQGNESLPMFQLVAHGSDDLMIIKESRFEYELLELRDKLEFAKAKGLV